MSDKGKVLRIEDVNEDTDIHEFAMLCKRLREQMENPQTEAEKLIYRIEHAKREECLALEEELKVYFASDAAEEDKREVGGYTESLSMICSAIRQGLL